MKAVERLNPKSSHHKEKIFFLFILYLYEMVDIHQIFCDNHFMMYISQIIMLHTINIHSAVKCTQCCVSIIYQ